MVSAAQDEARAAERRARIEESMRANEQRLTEQRWPYTGPRTASAFFAATASASTLPSQPPRIKTRVQQQQQAAGSTSAVATAAGAGISAESSGEGPASTAEAAGGKNTSRLQSTDSVGSECGRSPVSATGQRPPKPSSSSSRPAYKDTAAAALRAQATRQAMLEGKCDSREER